MSEWISVKDRLPEKYEIVWIYWRDREVLLGCKTDLKSEPEESWYSFDDGKCRWTNWWMPHIAFPCEEPPPPEIE